MVSLKKDFFDNIFLFFYEEIVDFSLYWLYTYVCKKCQKRKEGLILWLATKLLKKMLIILTRHRHRL